ncbi:YjcZ family sporulation protein [Neobacillus massiliamazoniensis]|nr:YjcZ family sporulation protein [Neobacillus massiliamazoniensis]
MFWGYLGFWGWGDCGFGYGGVFYGGSAFVLIVVLFILLIIVGTPWY